MSDDLLREFEVPPNQVGDMQRHNIVTLDLEGCSVHYIVCALNDEDKKQQIAHRSETWPAEIQRIMSRAIANFHMRNPDAVVRGFTQGVHNDVCTMAIHWRPK